MWFPTEMVSQLLAMSIDVSMSMSMSLSVYACGCDHLQFGCCIIHSIHG